MKYLWRNLVKEQMRKQEIKDLHDYFDFDCFIKSRISSIIEKVLSGQYRSETPLIYKSEKKYGICRHIHIPSPSDALVFQILTDVLYNAVVKLKPLKNAYYARDRHNLKLPHEHQHAGFYPWFILWPRFQEEILNFSKAHKYIVVTDLANYFDNIGLRELRHVISSIVKIEEVYLDLLFSIIENISWNPDYLPTTHKGLPTINIEAPRLLAHVLLFEIDNILVKRTKKSFVRWMDDINIGVDGKDEASKILGEVNDVLKSRGLALNLSKTNIYSSKEAEKHFLFQENLKLTKFYNRAKKLKSIKARKALAAKLRGDFTKHLLYCNGQNKDKITKRYYTIFGIIKVPIAVKKTIQLFIEQPSLRPSILRYMSLLPFNVNTSNAFVAILANAGIHDDVTLFQIVEALVNYAIPCNAKGKHVVSRINRILKKYKNIFEWYCYLYFLVKYGEPVEIYKISQDVVNYSTRVSFFSRQRVVSLVRYLDVNPDKVFKMWDDEIKYGTCDSSSVANNLMQIYNDGFPVKRNRLYMYLFPTNRQNPYPLPKFLILCIIALSEKRHNKFVKRPEVLYHVSDNWFRNWLNAINPYWLK